ncbi:kynurenine 3-monooxygenase [Lysobacter arseniciresistens ZS79]|uniref:Kynurenine 3-monooxygenase n=1 Tax=Lysobacter arseniciresistens ZS79 TaxID=913325 RepID=A0A0A0F3A3_9GAMM|nr:NAD(P)/FAD-dependent oxidoreductase [Lysobacter arseniciresistens]KGM57294.1 kynurenine 3-monooxygenase [Lysobacter arseniciresistens ZS79]
MNPPNDKHLTIIGAGLAGALLATLLARRGWEVDVYEKRDDPRKRDLERGRSINLALAERGRNALRNADADEAVMAQAVMMRGRMVHFADGRTDLQRYGRDDSEVIWSVHRGELNRILLDIAEAAGARVHFDLGLQSVDFEACTARYARRDGETHDVPFRTLIGADGAGSQLRQSMGTVADLGERTDFLDHSYKELEIPPAADGGFLIEPNALHIWPRGRYMCIALPNDEQTFTVTLFLPNTGNPTAGVPGFDSIRSGADARALFDREFPDASALIPRLEHDFDHNPTGVLGTLYLDRWHLDGRAVLVGDAAHAMVPFHGQGMNCAFEDCVALADHLDRHGNRAEAFAAFQRERLPNARAIQHMALENYLEMRDRVDDDDYLLQRALEHKLAERHPDRFVPRYAMVTFRHIPYAVALVRGNLQRELLVQLTRGHDSLATLDWDKVDAAVRAKLAPLPADR